MQKVEQYNSKHQPQFKSTVKEELVSEYIRDVLHARQWLVDILSKDQLIREDLTAIKCLLDDLLLKIRRDKNCQHLETIARPKSIDINNLQVLWNIHCPGCSLTESKLTELRFDMPLVKIAESIKFSSDVENNISNLE